MCLVSDSNILTAHKNSDCNAEIPKITTLLLGYCLFNRVQSYFKTITTEIPNLSIQSTAHSCKDMIKIY